VEEDIQGGKEVVAGKGSRRGENIYHALKSGGKVCRLGQIKKISGKNPLDEEKKQ